MFRWIGPLAIALVGSIACQPPQAAVEAQSLLLKGELDAAQRRVTEGLTADPESHALWRLRLRIAVERGR